MSPELYYAVMLITNPQKARRILLAEDLENWFMDLFDEEYEDILEGTFRENQEVYIDRIVDKYLEMTGVRMTAKDEYSRSVIDKAFKSASEIQETTWRNIIAIGYKPRKSVEDDNNIASKNVEMNNIVESENVLAEYILGGIAIGTALFATDELRKWLGRNRANLIALNEANWKWNNQEFFEAKGKKKTKIWHTALDERVRVTHMALEGVEIPVNDYFDVGGYPARYPLDSTLPIQETANCRCSIEYK